MHLTAERQNEVQELLDGGVVNAAPPPWYQALLAKYELALRAGKSTCCKQQAQMCPKHRVSPMLLLPAQYAARRASALAVWQALHALSALRRYGISRRRHHRCHNSRHPQAHDSMVRRLQAEGPACKLGRQRPARSRQPHHLRLHSALLRRTQHGSSRCHISSTYVQQVYHNSCA